MIYAFNEVDHNIYLLHEHLAFFFRQMFSNNPVSYDEALLARPEFAAILLKAKVSLREPLINIVKIYNKLPYGDKKIVEIAFSYNNCIDSFYDKDINPIKYGELPEAIRDPLKDFFVGLWEDYPQVELMKTNFGTLKSHYDALLEESNNDALVCPFCGINTFEPSGGKYKEDYDHIIPKADYPFASVNFRMLFPMCHKCNSKEKGSSDTLFDDNGHRRLVYYPYDKSIIYSDLEIIISPNQNYDHVSLKTLLRSIDWEITLLRNGLADERINSWDAIFGIKRRYKEHINRLEIHWFNELFAQFKQSKLNGQDFTAFELKILKTIDYQVLIAGASIIKLSYYKFMFSTANFEDRLNMLL